MNDSNFNPSAKQRAIFLLSWLSNINANKVNTLKGLEDHARTKIGEAMVDPALNPVLNRYFPDIVSPTNNPIVWGPYSYSHNPNAGALCVTDNAAFITKGIDPDTPTGEKALYVVAVSGTNPDSHFGWYDEDFLPTNLVAWPVVKTPSNNPNPLIDPAHNPYTGGINGGVSSGFATGLDILWNRMNQLNPATPLLFDALREVVLQDDHQEIEIAVTGHSLGGALSPMLALAIRDMFNSGGFDILGKTITVTTWPTAGPTPGEATFAKHLTDVIGIQNYKGVYNTLDIVPHGFAPQMMAELNTLFNYPAVYFCFDRPDKVQTETKLVDGLLKYAKTLPAGHNYQLSQGELGWQSTFTPQIIDPTSTNPVTGKPYMACGILKDLISIFVTMPETRHYLNTIYNERPELIYNTPRNAVDNMFGYLSQAGMQHTTVYVDEYLTVDQAKALPKYMGTDPWNYAGNATKIFKDLLNFRQLLANATHYFTKNPVK